jgi:LPXTG-site transpeptidase (sortase) family protein
MGLAMRRNLFAAGLIVLGLGLTGVAANGLGWIPGGQAAPAHASHPSALAPPLAMRHDPAVLAGTADQAMQTDPNTPIGTIRIPRLGVSAPIFERGMDAQRNMVIARGYAVTHFQFSSTIGAGNAVLYGHDDIEGSVFNRLSDLRLGDEIDIALTDGEQQVWHVTGRSIVAPSDVAILNPTHDTRLTLFTCWPTWVDTQRVVVTAALSL